MKIQYASDLHLEFADNWRYLKENPLQVTGEILVMAGDIGYLGDDNYTKHPFWDWASENYHQVIACMVGCSKQMSKTYTFFAYSFTSFDNQIRRKVYISPFFDMAMSTCFQSFFEIEINSSGFISKMKT